MARIAFVQNIVFEYLGVMYLSATLKKHGHQVEVFLATDNEADTITELTEYSPDIVGFSCTTGVHSWALEFSSALKQKLNFLAVFGGPHPTFFPEIINELQVDVVCRGEGEQALLELAEKTDRGEDITDTLNCWVQTPDGIINNDVRPLIDDLDSLPFPDRDLYAKYDSMQMSGMNFLAGRGCPFACSFCFNHAYNAMYKKKGKTIRFRSVENVIKEMRETVNKYKLTNLRLTDDTFILNKKWIADFSEQYRTQIGLPFFCTVRADLVDEDVIRNLKACGCSVVGLGIESGNEDLRVSLLKKKVSDSQINYCTGLLKKYGIKFRTYNMLGLPGETIEDAYKTIDLNIKIGTNYPWCSLFQPFPGTDLATYVIDQGFVHEGAQEITPSYFKDSIISSKHKNEIMNLQRLFIYAVKFPYLTPLIKKLAKLRPNIFFETAFLISYAWVVMLAENWTVREIVSMGRKNVKGFFFKEKK